MTPVDGQSNAKPINFRVLLPPSWSGRAVQMGGGGMNRWEAQVEAGLSSGKLKTWEIEPEKLILFDNRTLHRARPARKTKLSALYLRAFVHCGESLFVVGMNDASSNASNSQQR